MDLASTLLGWSGSGVGSMNLSVCATARTGLLASLGCLSLMALAGPTLPAKGMDHLRAIRESGFTENRGQWDSRALYFTGGPGKNVWVTRDGFVIDLFRNERREGGSEGSEDFRRGHVIRFQLEGSSPSAQAFGSSRIPRQLDYIQGGEQSRVVSTYAYKEAYVSNVYRGVDLRTYLDSGDFRYDLVAAPGADTSQIRFRVDGSDRITVDEKGSLVIQTSLGPVKQSRPIVFQQVGSNRKMVDAKFTVTGNKVGFKLGTYNRSLPLVIDPLVYGSYVGADSRGGESDDVVFDGGADAKGNLYMTGYTSSSNFPILNGPYGFNNRGARDSFLVRMAADAYALDYAAFIGGTGRDEGRGLAVAEEAGIVWIGGVTTSADFPGSVNRAQFTGEAAFWFLQYTLSPNGTLTPRFSRYYTDMGPASFATSRLPLLGDPFPTGVGTGAYFGGMSGARDGALYFAGDSLNVPASVQAFLPGASRGGRDGFIQRFERNLSGATRRFVGSTFADNMGRISATPDGGVAITGTVRSTSNQDTANPGADPLIWPTTAGVYPNGRLLRGADAFVVKMTPTLGVTFSSLLGGASDDQGVAAAVDPSGAVYVLSYGGSFDFPRTRGVYDAVNQSAGDDIVTKISADGSSLVYSTGLRHNDVVHGTSLAVDSRGIATVGGIVGFRYPGGTPPQAMIPGSIPTTPDALDAAYTGGNDSVFPNNRVAPDNTTGFRATYDGFVQVLNANGTNVLYASYLGGDGDEYVNQVFVDRVGATWILGYTQIARNGVGAIKGTIGVPGHITSNAFKEVPESTSAASIDGFAIKLRVGLPRLTGVSVSTQAVAGGLGAFTTGTVTLGAAAPAGGVVINLELSNPSVTSFLATGGQSRRSIVVPAGATTVNFPIFTSPVTVPQNSTLRATLDNDFLVTEVSVNPWLSEMTTTPGTLVGGNQVNLIVRLFQAATQEVRIPISTGNTSLIVPPTNNEIIVPVGATTASILLETGGVEASTDVSVSGSLLGVLRSTLVNLTRAELAAVSFNPNRILSSESTTMTMTFNGKVGADRPIAITQIGGVAVSFPATVTVFAQASSANATVTAPVVPTNQSATLQAACAGFTASQTFFIDPIDILDIQIQPSTTVLGGTVVTGRVNLTRPAGQVPITVMVSSSNASAGSFTAGTIPVTVEPGQSQSTAFEFRTNVVGTNVATTLTASRTGLTSRSVVLNVLGVGVSLSVTPGSLLGGTDSATATVSISRPAPAGGATLVLSTNDPAASISPSTVTIPEGQTAPATGTVITVSTVKVATDTPVDVTATLSPLSSATQAITVRAPAVTGVVLARGQVTGGTSTTGTVTIETEAPESGMTLNLSSSDAAAVVPATVFIAGGATTATFPVTTSPVSTSRVAIITAAGSSSSASAELGIEAVSVGRIRFNPSIVRGGQGSTATVTLNSPAPAGGLTLSITSDTPSFARPTVTTINIAAGQSSGTFAVTTSRVSRRLNIGFNVTIVSTGTSGRGFLGVSP
jgi:hypothetical protein